MNNLNTIIRTGQTGVLSQRPRGAVLCHRRRHLAVNRRTGVFAINYALVAICLPRIYAGIHYSTDVIAGGALGFGAAAALVRWRGAWTGLILRTLERYPGRGHALFFLLTFQIATLLWNIRVILSYLGFST